MLQRRMILAGAVGVLLGYFAVAGLLKASNEPVVSNRWTSCSVPELATIQWSDTHLQASSVWTGFDERIRVCSELRMGASPNGNAWDAGAVDVESANALISDYIQLHAARLQLPLPELMTGFRIYDNGQVVIYHRRPATPYQQ